MTYTNPSKVNIQRLKDFALRFPKESLIRDLITAEKDELEVTEFIAKMDLWLKILERSR